MDFWKGEIGMGAETGMGTETGMVANKGMVSDIISVWKDYLILAVVATVIAVIILAIVKVVNSYFLENPVLGAKKLQALEEAKKLDADNEAANMASKEQAEAKEKARREERLVEIEEELEELKTELNRSREDLAANWEYIEKSDIIGSDEKSLQTVQMLIYFIESRRADSIKEALHEYDKAKMNEKLLKYEEQRNELERQKIENERVDREKKLKLEQQHQKEMEYIARENARGMEDLARRVDNFSQQSYFSSMAAADAAKRAGDRVADKLDKLYYSNY